MLGFRWNNALVHLGDLLARTSLCENYYRNTGEKLVNIDNLEYFKFNPFCVQGVDIHPNTLSRVEVRDIWNYQSKFVDFNDSKTMAHELCKKWDLEKCYKAAPDVYQYHELEKDKFTRSICICPQGQTVGTIPLFILNFIRNKYSNHNLFQLGYKNDIDANADFDRRGLDFWDSCKLMAQMETVITIDSLPAWMAKCYSSIRLKILLVNRNEQQCEIFLPRGYENKDNHWSGWLEIGSEYYNCFEEDLGCTKSYLKI